MKVTVQTGALQDALALAGSIVQSRSPKPVLKCVKLVAADNVLTVLATDLEVGCRYQITAVQIDEPGEALVPADRPNGIAREASGDSLTLVRDLAWDLSGFAYDSTSLDDIRSVTIRLVAVVDATPVGSRSLEFDVSLRNMR